MKTQHHSIGGYTVISSNQTRTIWEGDDLLATLPGDTTDLDIEQWISGYCAGFERGYSAGRRQLQREIRRLIGAA